MRRLWIKNGLVIDPASGIEGRRDVLIEGSKIAAVKRPGSFAGVPGAEVLDASGCWVIPGIIDLHVHLREPGPGDDETIATGTEAAARGGVTSVLAMPNTKPPIDSPKLVRFVRERSKKKASVNVLVTGAVTKAQRGEELTQFEKLAAAGAAAFSDDGRPVMNAALMRRALELSKKLGLPVMDHAEDDNLTGCGVVHEGTFSRRRGLPGIPALSEVVMSLRDIALARATGGHLHICHVSCAGAVELVKSAKKHGLRVTAEAAPHHFTLTDADIPDEDADFKMKPPLRSKSDREALIQGLADGTIDAIATDHAPHAPTAKALGIRRAPFGVIGLETLLPLSLELVRKGRLSRRQLVERLSCGPARILGLKAKESLAPGTDADVTVIDPAAERTVTETSASKSRNSPFIGRQLKGLARATIVAGEVVFRLLPVAALFLCLGCEEAETPPANKAPAPGPAYSGGGSSSGGSGDVAISGSLEESKDATPQNVEALIASRYQTALDLIKKGDWDGARGQLLGALERGAGTNMEKDIRDHLKIVERGILAQPTYTVNDVFREPQKFEQKTISLRGKFLSGGDVGQASSYFWLNAGARIQCLYQKLSVEDKQLIGRVGEGSQVVVRGVIKPAWGSNPNPYIELSYFRLEKNPE